MDAFYQEIVNDLPYNLSSSFKTFYDQDVRSLCNFLYSSLTDCPQIAGLLRRIIARYINSEICSQFGYSLCITAEDIILLYYLDNESWDDQSGWCKEKIRVCIKTCVIEKWILLPKYISPIIISIINIRIKRVCHLKTIIQFCDISEVCIYKIPQDIYSCKCFSDFVYKTCCFDIHGNGCFCHTQKFVFNAVIQHICKERKVIIKSDTCNIISYFKDRCKIIEDKLHIDLEGQLQEVSSMSSH